MAVAGAVAVAVAEVAVRVIAGSKLETPDGLTHQTAPQSHILP